MKSLIKMKIVLALALAFGQGEAFAICKRADIDIAAAQNMAAKFVQNMKVSKARGDIETMTSSYQTFGEAFYNQCQPEEKLKFCGFDCHIELAEYNLFMANDLAYYYKSSNSALKTEGFLAFAQNGISIVETAKELLNKQKSSDFRDYVFQSGRYTLILAQLYMTAGDHWYQSVSETKLERLRFLIGKTLKDSENAESESDKKTKTASELARDNYEKANWVLQSAALEIPEDDQQFSSLSADLFSKRYAIEQRLTSLDKGYIFLNIDPEEFSQISFEKLKTELDSLVGRINEAEKNIENLMGSWKQSKLGRDTEEINEEARRKDISIAQSSYRIAKLEQSAQAMSNTIEAKLLEVGSQKQTFEYERQKFEYEFGLKMKLQELNDRQTLIQSRKEADIIQFDLSDQDRKLNDLRWLMGWELSKTNLEIQVSQFESEIARLESDITIKSNQKDQTGNRKTINSEQIKIANANIQTSKNNQKSLEFERDELNKQQIGSLEAQLCSVRNRMAFVGEALPAYEAKVYSCQVSTVGQTETSYREKMCGPNGLRQRVNAQNINSVAKALCAIGYDSLPPELKNDSIVKQSLTQCEGVTPTTELAFAREIFKKEMELADKEIEASEANRARLYALLTNFLAQTSIAATTQATMETVVKALEASLSVAASIPTTSVCACGLSSGAITTIDVKASMSVAVDSARESASRFITWSKFVLENLEKAQELEIRIKNILAAIEQQKLAKDIKNFHAMQAIAGIMGRSEQFQQDIISKLIERETIIVDCDREGTNLDETKASLRIEHDRLVTEIKSVDLRANNINRSIQNEVLSQQKELSSISVLNAENANLNIELNSIDTELATLRRLREDTKTRKDLVANLQIKINGLERQATAAEEAVARLTKIKNDKLIAIADDEYAQVERVINQNNTFTKKLVEYSDKLQKLDVVDQGLRTEINQFKISMDKQVADEREKLMNTLYLQAADASNGQKEKMFMATQEQMAALSKSVPNFIEEKRELLQQANRILILMRNQIKSLTALQGESALSLGTSKSAPYVRTLDDLSKLKEVIKAPLLAQQQPITIQTTRIVIPSGSGLARTLATERKASFEINPFARGQMERLGYFSLWSSSFDADTLNGLTQNLLLVDVNIVVNFSACQNAESKVYVLKHTGNGFVFKETSELDATPVPIMVVAQARKDLANYDIKTTGSIAEASEAFWMKKWRLNNFLSTAIPPNVGDGGTLPPLLGLPLFGTYELTLPPPSEGCGYDNATYVLYLTYSTNQRPS
ncbi:MAG TPA: hypothetical protein VFO10_23435 [Oligoflexus sp.]|uniref:hypothetical protein n=1 Tax=Oligoflexus sp. TaxID=1971216 RepID=UPI002D7EE04C|nr:hypothetical protein [Oligoflexus sp.]HET9240236.1 hypothetical protein [Oligoflexus sp.]